MYAIKTERLTKKYKDITAVDSLDLSIGQGELFALLGVNGAGKTTTIKMLSCLVKPDSGDAFVNNSSVITNSGAVKNMIGVSPQETAVAPNLSVKENLELMCGIHGFHKEKRRGKIKELSERLELTDMLSKRAGKLSGGWQRRLSIAMALISEPQVLFLDEPTLGLDVLARSDLWDTIRALKGSITIILTTHYMEEVEQLCNRIAILDKGKVIALGTKEALKELTTMGEKITVEAPNLKKAIVSELKTMENIIDVKYEDATLFVTYKKGEDNLEKMISFLKENNVKYTKIFSELPTLNDVFLELTGKQLRD